MPKRGLRRCFYSIYIQNIKLNGVNRTFSNLYISSGVNGLVENGLVWGLDKNLANRGETVNLRSQIARLAKGTAVGSDQTRRRVTARWMCIPDRLRKFLAALGAAWITIFCGVRGTNGSTSNSCIDTIKGNRFGSQATDVYG